MARTTNYFMSTILLIVGQLIILTLDFTVAQIGVCYGRRGNNLPPPSEVVALFNQYNIQRMRIYDPDQATLQALEGSNIEVTLGVPNTDLQSLAASQDNANAWVRDNVLNYPNVRFRYIVVGNNVSPIRGDTSQFAQFLLPALRNVYNAIAAGGNKGKIKTSTAVDTGVLRKSHPPEDGAFRSDVTSYLNPIVEYLVKVRAPLLVNMYPYLSYIGNKSQFSLPYSLFLSNGVVMPDGTRYQNLLYAMIDAMYAALEKSDGSAVGIVVAESGWPSAGGDTTSLNLARIYNNNLIQRVKNGQTPKRPGQAIEAYLFAMFNENQRPLNYQKHFGLFWANKRPKYPINFS